MNLIVFGATGLVGKQLTEQLYIWGSSGDGHWKKCIYHRLSADGQPAPGTGALFDTLKLLDAIRDDAVLSAIGSGQDGTDKIPLPWV